ncbi:protein-cysteine N-palmitoyltransferase HHAT-like [Diadema antillarum]|uniref:protein-cysteine N-palmitoyltransferase HHAT-like n=1 Tax=Diadema antillarum TaxID=105358 RepID=UPI003A877714
MQQQDDQEIIREESEEKTPADAGVKRYVTKDYAELPSLEVLTYGLFLITVFSKAFYAVFLASNDYKERLYSVSFEDGWFIFGHRDKDIADYEWTQWRVSFFSYGAWIAIVLHALLGRIVGYVYPKYRTLFLLGFALTSITLMAGFKLLLVFLCHSLLVYVVTCTGSTKAVWCTVLLQISSVNLDFFLDFQRLVLDNDEMNLVIYVVALGSLRHLSFAIEYCQYHSVPAAKRPDQKQYWSVANYLLYVYYLPLFFTGPLLSYDKFSKQIHLRIHMLIYEEWKHIVKELARYLFWALFSEMVLHFLYFPAFHARTLLLNSVPLWTIGGLALCHLLFFQIKYVVMYGLPRVHAMFDHVNAPLPPVCVLGMYLFQDFWRYFDRGLHTILVKCIYIPLGGSRSGIVWQCMASVACFTFVCYWHGTDLHLVYWAVFNCAGLQLEVIVSKIAHMTRLNHLLMRYLSGAMYRRLIAFILTPNYMCLALSNLIFLGGEKAAHIYYKRLLSEDWPNSFFVTFATFYCTIQIIMTIHRKYGKDFMCSKFYYRSW